MNLFGILFLGIRYLSRNRVKTLLLVGAFTLVLFLPLLIGMVVEDVRGHLRLRAEVTPLLLGRAGSPLELAFNGLYFAKPKIKPMPYGEVAKLNSDAATEVIPLYARFRVGEYRIVGTELDYFDFRNMEIAAGRQLIRVGECVIGSRVAQQKGLKPGDSVVSSPEALFDLAGVYPLKMNICGVLKPTGTADDRTVFVDLRTTWIIEGLGHGHQEADKTAKGQRLANTGKDGSITLNASVAEYNEVTPENADKFHFHGEESDLPLSAVIVIPGTAKKQAILKARFASSHDFQLISPAKEMDELFATIFSVQRMVNWILFAVGTAALAIGGLVFLLSYRLRISEFENLRNIGADPSTTRSLILFEAVFVVLCSAAMVLLLLGVASLAIPSVIRLVLG